MLTVRSGAGMEPVRRVGSGTDRVGYCLIAVGAAGTLLLARLTEPSPAGHGTHLRIGLPPCSFQLLTGHGCPGCGLTTSFSHMARGALGEAFAANPMGPVVFGLAAVTAVYATYRVWRPVPLEQVVGSRAFLVGAVAVLAGMLVGWAVRLALGGA